MHVDIWINSQTYTTKDIVRPNTWAMVTRNIGILQLFVQDVSEVRVLTLSNRHATTSATRLDQRLHRNNVPCIYNVDIHNIKMPNNAAAD